MNELNELLNLDFRGWVYTCFLIMACVIAIFKIGQEFTLLVKLIYCKVKKINTAEKNKEQDDEIGKIKERLNNLEKLINIVKENDMISTWDRIVHFGMNYVERGHISYAEKDIFMAQTRSYSKCGGNGHLVGFIPCVNDLPYTEDLNEEEIEAIEKDAKAKRRRVALAKGALSAYYGK